ncbi:MAG: adenylate/guanylate cyclase domain-containing protein [Spirochaetales bacterium]|nr:adenylate/guanylate cyclase domain-containing protein [Spirochaetales bacterium]
MSFIFQIGSDASRERLDKLIEERLKPGANKKDIDKRIWDLFGETWSVMFTDLSGFSRQVAEFGIIHFLQIIFESQVIIVPCIDRYDGIMLKMEGDSMMLLFRRPEKALACAIAMQKASKEYNIGKEKTEQMLLCIGLGYGMMLRIGDNDIFGAEVNAASKLGEDIADAWEILITENFKNAITDTSYTFEKIEEIPPGAKSAYKLIYEI